MFVEMLEMLELFDDCSMCSIRFVMEFNFSNDAFGILI